MSLKRLHFKTREEWLEGRDEIKGIGGSDAAAALGYSKRKTPVDLWREKTGRAAAKDLSGVDYVQLGNRTEGPMRGLFAALHPEYEVKHFPFDILYQPERPWLFATLDGELTDIATQEHGILEIKKFEVQEASDWALWKDQVPQDYFCQVLHQLAATDYDFAWLWALLLKRDGNAELREYFFPRWIYEKDIGALVAGEIKFQSYVDTGKIPPQPLRL